MTNKEQKILEVLRRHQLARRNRLVRALYDLEPIQRLSGDKNHLNGTDPDSGPSWITRRKP
jgi:hypothetical protein